MTISRPDARRDVPPRLGLGAAVVATILAGGLYGQCFPTASVRSLAWVALAPFLVAVPSGVRRRAAGLGWLVMLVLAYGVNDWFPRAVSTYYLQPALVGVGFFFGVTTFTAAPATMLFALWYRRAAARPSPWLPVTAAAAWVGGEALRTRVLGDPWVLFGYSQVGVDTVTQVADLAGVYGVSFVLVAVNVAIAEMLRAIMSSGRELRRAAAGLGVAAVVVTVALGYGVLRLRMLDGEPGAATRTVAVVQANLDLGSQWRQEFYGRNLDGYLRLTAARLARGGVDLVVWPESANTFFLDTEPAYRRAIASVLHAGGTQLVVGGPSVGAEGPHVYHNSAFLLSPAGEIVGRYDKRRLLPFAEYFPLPELDFLRRRFGRVREFTPGAPTAILQTAIGPAGVIICNEALFAAPARERVREGAEVLVVLTNDSWVGEPKYAWQAFDMAVMRAIEQRRPLVRSSTSGPSAIVDAAGRVRIVTEFASAATIDGSIAARRGTSAYGRVGDLFALLCVLVSLVVAIRPTQAAM